MSRKREEYGQTLQEKRVPTPEHDLHKKAKKSKKGPYVVTASSFYMWDNMPTYWWVTHIDALPNMRRQNHWKTLEVYGEGENWTYKQASIVRREYERSARLGKDTAPANPIVYVCL